MSDDARLRELIALDRLERGQQPYPTRDIDESTRRLVIHLFREGFVEDTNAPPPWVMGVNHPLGVREYALECQWAGVRNVMQGGLPSMVITHRGAVRRAELEQRLQTGRIKETMGFLWDGRHFQRDARIALLDASVEHPLAVAYLDLNDVKSFNSKGHSVGDQAIRRYLELVADVFAGRGEAYRLSGGADEVVVLLPRCSLENAVSLTRAFLTTLRRERVEDLSLRAAAGVVVATDPAEAPDQLKARADAEQQRSKDASRHQPERPSYLAWPGGPASIVAADQISVPG